MLYIMLFKICYVLVALSVMTSVSNATRPKILMSDPSIPQIAFELLGKNNDLINITKVDKNEILEKVKGVDAIFWANYLKLDSDILNAAGPQMKIVATMSAGYNHIDINEIKSRKIKLGNTRGVLSSSVADMAVLLALAASRRLQEGRTKIETNTWNSHNQWLLGQDIDGSTVGIIGLGSIGLQIAKRLIPFGVKHLLYTGHREKVEGTKLGAKFVDLDTINRKSDFIIVSASLNNETLGLLDDNFFSKTKKSAVVVNISRGAVIVQDALIRALKEGRLFAAGLDVMTPEPLPTDSELLQLPNVVLTPHIGSATIKTRNAMAELAANNILMALDGKEMKSPVFY